MKAQTSGSLEFFALLAICLQSVQANVVVLPEVLYYNVTATPRSELYIMQNQRQFMAHIKSMEQQLTDFKVNYDQRVETISFHNELIETKLNELESKLNPLELLDEISDYCVQKYRSKIPVLNTLKTSFTTCTQKANSPYAGLIAGPTNTFTNMKNYYANQHANALKECKKKWGHGETNYTTCITTAVKVTAGVTNTNNLSFQNQLKAASCTATMKIKETFDCYADIVFNTFNTIGEVMGLVENCRAGQEFCPSCVDETELVKGRCPYHLGWHLSDEDLRREQINNPFKGINKTTPCLQINFINRGFTLL